ncbi:MAG: glycine cleavage system protein GcvH [Spirochaetes bacterium]|nr:glycine cleavage system protein GcvH [Spirochaetota bacterium]
MSLIPEDLVYSRNHIWLRLTDEFTAACGITDHCQDMLRDIAFVELIDEGIEVSTDEKILYIESIIDIYNILSPLSGKVLKINSTLGSMPGIINDDPYGEGWIFELDIRSRIELEVLMDHEAYREFIEE